MTADKQNRKEAYVAPFVEVIEVENEGVIAASGFTEDYNPTPMGGGNTRSYNSASSNDLEDLINDILTVEN